MKRILLAVLILTAGTSVFCALQSSTRQFRQQSATGREAWIAETQSVAQARIELSTRTERLRELKESLSAQPRIEIASDLTAMLATNRLGPLPPELRERLLEELGFNWNATGDFLVVSKETLRSVGMEAFHGDEMTEVAASVLALTDQERAAVEAASQRAVAERQNWLLDHAQRLEPKGDVVANYVIPADPAFSQTASNSFAGVVLAALGAERAGLLLDYARSWMGRVGMLGEHSRELQVRGEGSGGEPRYTWSLHYSGRISSSQGLAPYHFPEAFRPLFPNGWPEMAAREGFELPKEFHQNAETR